MGLNPLKKTFYMAEEIKQGENLDNKNQFKSEEEMTPAELQAEKEREELILNFKAEDLQDETKKAALEEALKNSKTTIAQKRHFREKYNELKGAVKPAVETKTEKTETADEGSSVMLELRQDNPWMTKEVAKEIVATAKSRNESVETTMQRPYIASWLLQIKADLEVENASLAPSKKGGGGSGATERDWSQASPEDMEKQRIKIMSRGS